VTGEIAVLLQLQEMFLSRQKKLKNRDTLPAELSAVDAAYKEKVSTVEQLRKTIAEADRLRRAGEARVSDFQEKLKKYQTQLMAVRNQREYGAALNEIDLVKKELRQAEDDVVGHLETIETSTKDLAEREERLPQDTAEHEAELSGWRESQKDIDREISEAGSRIAELEKQFTPARLSEFYRLFERKGGHAVARAVGGSCSACHVRLRPALYQTLRLSGDIVFCDSCKRILYYDPEAAASP
jgi:predicted  nucleic acid-binding Zn-ribbon protein